MAEHTALTGYADPVVELFSIGEPASHRAEDWPDYPAQYGFGAQDVQELIRLACDRSADTLRDDDPRVWAPLHATRALAKLRALECVAPFLGYLVTLDDDFDDYIAESLPQVFSMIGSAAIPQLASCLANPDLPTSLLCLVTESLGTIGISDPEARERCVALVREILKPRADSDRVANGIAVWVLIDLKAVEAIDTIRAAFASKRVEESVCGDLEDVEIALGLRMTRDTPEPLYDHGLGPAEPAALPRDEFLAALTSDKIGRNEPCPCGSGRKYKKCCLV